MRKLILILILLLIQIDVQAEQCKAITKKGIQCKREARSNIQYCAQHSKLLNIKSEIKDTLKVENTNVSISNEDQKQIQCKAITKKGTQCKRKSVSGKEYCFQHEQ